MRRRHLILVGLPGSGKSTVGRLVAQRLGTTFVDLDGLIERRASKSVARIFAEDGEPAFRRLEADVAREQLALPEKVLAAGGGLFTDPALRRDALAAGYAVYLETSPLIAAVRLKDSDERPLLQGDAPELALRRLLEQRQAAYLEAQGRVRTDDLGPEQVADRVVELARSEGGW